MIQVTLVIADGSILTVNAEENKDLFWAIRGSGSNFGVVTEFVFKLHPQRRTVFSGNAVFSIDVLDPIMDWLKAWWESGPSEKESILQFLTLGPGGQVSSTAHNEVTHTLIWQTATHRSVFLLERTRE